VRESEENKSSISRDLDTMARLLVKYDLCKNPKPLYDAVTECLNRSNGEYWNYKITGLRFDIDNIGHILPHGADLLEADFSIVIKGNYCDLETICNPIIDIEFNIELIGTRTEINDLHSSWHLDKHPLDEDGEETKFIHPEYHFTFGGRRMWHSGKDYGAALVLSSPRLIHPPMDAILGIDFIIQNYISKKRRKSLTQDREYRKLLYNSQLRIWRPFWISVASAWNKFPFDSIALQPAQLAPNIVCSL